MINIWQLLLRTCGRHLQQLHIRLRYKCRLPLDVLPLIVTHCPHLHSLVLRIDLPHPTPSSLPPELVALSHCLTLRHLVLYDTHMDDHILRAWLPHLMHLATLTLEERTSLVVLPLLAIHSWLEQAPVHRTRYIFRRCAIDERVVRANFIDEAYQAAFVFSECDEKM